MGALQKYIDSQQGLREYNRGQSVMNRPSEEPWQPEYEKEPGLEPSSPEDYIPNPKSLAAGAAKIVTGLGSLKGAALFPVSGALGMLKGETYKQTLKRLNSRNNPIKAIDELMQNYPDELKGIQRKVFERLGQTKYFFPDHPDVIYNFEDIAPKLLGKEDYMQALLPPKPTTSQVNLNAVDRLNEVGHMVFGNTGYLPYTAKDSTFKKMKLSDLIKKEMLKPFNDEPDNLIENAYDRGIKSLKNAPASEIIQGLRNDVGPGELLGIQGLAHGVDDSGNFMHLNSIDDLFGKSSIIGAHQDATTPQTIYHITDDGKKLEQIVDEFLKGQ